MEVFTGFIVIGTEDNENLIGQTADHIILPTDFKLFSYNNDLTATFQY